MAPVTFDAHKGTKNQSNGNLNARNAVIFDQTKSQPYSLGEGLRSLQRSLRSQYRVSQLNPDQNIDDDTLTVSGNDGSESQCRLFVIAQPRARYTSHELDSLRRFLSGGGSILVMLGEGGELSADTNINFFLEEFGIMVNNDTVIRTVFYKYFHPKEALVSNGVLNRAIITSTGSATGTGHPTSIPSDQSDSDSAHQNLLHFIYPFGASLSVGRPAVPILSTGSACFPINRPVVAVNRGQLQGKGGKLAVVGSVHMFHDDYIDKEDNAKIWDALLQFLTDDNFRLNSIDADDPDVADYHTIPDHIHLSEQIKSCLHESDAADVAPRDLTRLFDSSLHSMDLSLLASCMRSYNTLGLKHEPLSLIPPQFESPLPTLIPAVFPPRFRDPGGIKLELFDLDEAFSSEKVRLAQVTNKCSGDEDIEYLIVSAGEILNITTHLPQNQRGASDILEFIFHQLVEYKKLNQPVENGAELGYGFGLENGVYASAIGAGASGFQELGEQDFSDLDEFD